MLYLNTVEPTLLKIASALAAIKKFDSFRLVGGTAAALYLGHRKSTGIDFFSNENISPVKIVEVLQNHFPTTHKIDLDTDTATTIIKGIKVDIYPGWHTPFTDPPVTENNLRLASLRDLAILKINSIVGRREKKDYIDLFYIFKHLDFQEVVKDFKRAEPLLTDKSILFALGEAETAATNKSPMPAMLVSYNWEEIINKMNEVKIRCMRLLEKQHNRLKPPPA